MSCRYRTVEKTTYPLYLHSPQSATRIPGYKERLTVLQQLTGYTNTATVNGNGSSSDVALQEMRQLQNTARHNELRKDLLQGRAAIPLFPVYLYPSANCLSPCSTQMPTHCAGDVA